MKVRYPSSTAAATATRSDAGGGRFTTNPPFAPTGTMTAFFTDCAFIRPRISVRKSSRRSDQRMPPHAMSPARRWTPSTAGDATQISCCGRGRGRKSSACGSNLKARYGRFRYAFVRTTAPTTCPRARRIRSASRLATASIARRARRRLRPRRPDRAAARGRGAGGTTRRSGAPAPGSPRACRRGTHPWSARRPDGGTGRGRARSRLRAERPARSTSRLSSSFSIVAAHTPRKTSATRACTAGSPSGSPTSSRTPNE